MNIRKQFGTISFQLAGIIGVAVLITLLGGAVWLQQERIEAAVTAKKAAEEQLKTANDRITEIAKVNKRLDDTIELFKTMTELNKAQATLHSEENKKLLETVSKVTKTLPTVKPRAEEKAQPKEQVDKSFQRAQAMREAYCLVNIESDQCIKLKTDPTLNTAS